ncbi:MAG TPA: hypothetical protein VMU09_00610 [Acidimicrobiales bacterium]|nr:hypothetical protein [Acidimicrobiales bacterium]
MSAPAAATGAPDPAAAHRLWRTIEPLHAVTYFAEECLDAHAAAGLRGFWMGYFAGRAAPLGAVGPGVVTAIFFGFHPDRVRRALPDAWSYAAPSDVLVERRQAAAGVLRTRVPAVEELAGRWEPALSQAVEAADGGGRPLFAANRDLEVPDDPVEALWHACTCLREQRGDGHVALLAAEGLDGCEANVLAAAVKGIPEEVIRESRGWSPEEWGAATGRLAGRGLFDPDGALTDEGVDLHRHIEHRTDELAGRPYESLGHQRVTGLLEALLPAARAVAPVIRFPNPMGLPPPPA